MIIHLYIVDRLRAKSEETESQYVDEKEDKSSLLEVCVTLKPCDDLPFIDEQVCDIKRQIEIPTLKATINFLYYFILCCKST